MSYEHIIVVGSSTFFLIFDTCIFFIFNLFLFFFFIQFTAYVDDSTVLHFALKVRILSLI